MKWWLYLAPVRFALIAFIVMTLAGRSDAFPNKSGNLVVGESVDSGVTNIPISGCLPQRLTATAISAMMVPGVAPGPLTLGRFLRGMTASCPTGLSPPDDWRFVCHEAANPAAGNQLDHEWVRGEEEPLVWDLGTPETSVLVFPSIDHGPMAPAPYEALEFTVWGSNDAAALFPEEWTCAALASVYVDGWVDAGATRESDDFASLWTFTQPFRFVAVYANSSMEIQPEVSEANQCLGSGVWCSRDVEIDAVGAASGGLPPSPCFRDALLGISNSEQGARLIRIDPDTGQGTEIGLAVAPYSINALAVGPSGTLYGVANNTDAQTAELYSINPPTGAATFIGSSNNPSVNGLAFNGAMYAVRGAPGNKFLGIDLSNGAATEIGSGLGVENWFGGLEFAPDGTLYAALHTADGTFGLYTVDTATGLASKVVDFSGGPGLPTFLSIAFLDDGRAFLSTDGGLYSLDIATGSLSLVGEIGFPFVSALTGFCGSGCPPGAVFCDDFNDNSTDSSSWVPFVQGSGPGLAEVNRRLEITLPAGSVGAGTNNVFIGAYRSLCKLRGDFDIEVVFQLLDWPYANGVRVGLLAHGEVGGGPPQLGQVERTSFGAAGDFPGEPREVYLTHFASDGVQGITPTSDRSGKLRLVRLAGALTGYYLSSGEWVPIHSAAAASDDVNAWISVWSHDVAFTDQEVRVAFDNFIVNEGELVCPDDDGDGLPDDWELAHFGNLSWGPDGDPDHDGFSNLEEFDDGTNPAAPDLVIQSFLISTTGDGTVDCGSTANVSRGETFTFDYEIFNPHSRAAQAVLGASLCLPPPGETCDPSRHLILNSVEHDDLVELPPGVSSQSRLFDLPADAPAGLYSGLWGLLSPLKTRRFSTSVPKCDELVDVQQAGPPITLQLGDVVIGPTRAKRGSAVFLSYEIGNPGAVSVPARLGAAIRLSGTGSWVEETADAQIISVVPGRREYLRVLRIPGGERLLSHDVRWTVVSPNGEVEYGNVVKGQSLIVLNRDATDSDGDGLPDDWELDLLGDLFGAADEDPDSDGLTNADELAHATNPLDEDTDWDGFHDGDEVDWGSDPADPSDFPTPSPPLTGDTPLIFIPGIGGTELVKDGAIWPPEGELLQICDQWLEAFRPGVCGLDDCLAKGNTAMVGKVVGQAVVDIYGDFMKFLRKIAESNGNHFEPFPYDWRLHIDRNADNPADALDELITKKLKVNCRAGQRVDIVAHSQGGLVAKAYLAASKENERCVHNLITLGTPHYGSVKMLGALLFGEDDIVGEIAQVALDKDMVARVLTNMPSAYQLLPSRILNDQGSVFVDENDFDADGKKGGLVYDDLLKMLENTQTKWKRKYCFLTFNDPLNSNARSWVAPHQDRWDVWTPSDLALHAYFFAGTGVPTLTKIVYKKGRLLSADARRESGDGDGTVPTLSAEAEKLKGNVVRKEFRHETACNRFQGCRVVADARHFKMLGNPAIRDEIKKILTGSQAPLASISLPKGRGRRGLAGPAQPSAWLQVSLYSDGADLHLFDALGNHVGPTGETADREIASSQYSDFGPTETAVVPYGGRYTIEVRAPDGGVGDLTLSRYAGPSPEKIQRYFDISLSAGGVARMTFTELNDEDFLEVDEDGDGYVDRSVAPSNIPVANAGPDQVADEGTVVTLEGSGHPGAGPGPLTYAWSQVSGPSVSLSDPAASGVTFTLPEVEEDQVVTLQLVVNDGEADSESDMVNVTIKSLHDDLIPGGGSAKADCFMEWAVENPANPLGRKGLPSNRQTCTDGISSCDFDEAVGICGFRLKLCFNVYDPRLVAKKTGEKRCNAVDVADLIVQKPSEKDASRSTVDAANRSAILTAVAGVIPTASQSCTAPFELRVPLRGTGERPRKNTVGIRVAAVTSPTERKKKGYKDTDTLKLTCIPNPTAAAAGTARVKGGTDR